MIIEHGITHKKVPTNLEKPLRYMVSQHRSRARMPQLIKQLPNPSGLLSKNCNFKGIGQLEQS